ncbi:MAG: GTP-binding protein [Kofleriaceae bacterium]
MTAADDAEPGAAPAVPFSILTGWLGAGKTTALNRVLGAPHGRRLAVLVNELGRIAIDSRLILRRGGDILELAGGCVCCKVDLKNDLWDGIHEIVSRARPDQIVLETTGIAEPAAILEGLARVPAATRDRIRPVGVVAVADAEALPATVARRDEARAQLELADRVLLSKLDVASPAAVAAAHAALDVHAAHAERAAFPGSDDGAMALTAWLLDHRRVRHAVARDAAPDDGHRGHHHHGSQLVAVAFADDAPLLGARVLEVARGLGDRLVRAKGFLHLADDDRRGFLEKAGAHLTLTPAAPWGDAARTTELVLIGDDLDEAAVRRALWACRAGA